MLETKVVKLSNNLYAKMESENPSGSYKDKEVYEILTSLENLAEIKTIIYGGDIGYAKALAYSSKLLNKECMVSVLDNSCEADISFIENNGGVVVRTPAKFGLEEAEIMASDMKLEVESSYLLKPLENKLSASVHLNKTGPEIIKYVDNVDYFICEAKEITLFNGLAKFFLKKTDAKIIAVVNDDKEYDLDLADEVESGELMDIANRYSNDGVVVIIK